MCTRPCFIGPGDEASTLPYMWSGQPPTHGLGLSIYNWTNATHCWANLYELPFLLHQQHRHEHVTQCQLHYCMQCIVLAAKDLDKSRPVQCTGNLHQIYTVLLIRSLAHYSCSWPTQLDQAVLVVVVVSSSSPIASAKLKQSQLFECCGIYGIWWRLAKLKLSNELERGDT